MTAVYRCGRCGKPVKKDAFVCPHCGVRLAGIRCQSCGYAGSAKDFAGDRCPRCRSVVRVPAPSRPASTTGGSKGCTVVALITVLAVVAIAALALLGPNIGEFMEETTAELQEQDREEVTGAQPTAVARLAEPVATVPEEQPQVAPEPEAQAPVEPPAPDNAYEQALAGTFAGTTVQLLVPGRGEDQALFLRSLDPFQDETGINVDLQAADVVDDMLRARVQAGDPPDIAALSNLQLAAELAGNGGLIDVSTALDQAWLRQNYHQGWLESAMLPGPSGDIMAGVWHHYNPSSLVFYPKDDFEVAGYQVPETWDDLLDLSEQIAADGGTPWCIGMESGSATGWVACDWLDDILLRTGPVQTYDRWIAGGLDFDSARVSQALELLSGIWFEEGYVQGGQDSISEISFADSPAPLFDDPPGCWLHLQGSFITDFFPAEARYDEDYGWFPLPPMDAGSETPCTFHSGTLMAMFDDRPEVQAVMAYLSRGASARPWIEEGLALSPHNDAPLAWYDDPFLRSLAEQATETSTFRPHSSAILKDSPARWEFMTGYVENQLVLHEQSQPTPTLTRRPAPTETPTPTKRPQPTNTPAQPPTPTPPPAPDAVVVAPTLNLRTGPGTSYGEASQLAQGDQLQVIGQSGGCAWLQVISPSGQRGWVSGDGQYVDLQLACADLPAGTFRPSTGIIQPNTRGGGMGELEVVNGTSTDGLVVLAYNEQPVASAYIRAGETVNLQGIQDGTYYLFFSTGSGWNGERFTVDDRYKRFDDAFPYETTATSYTGWSVTLHGVVGGTASASNVDPSQFPGMGQ